MNLRELLVKGHEAQGIAKAEKEEANRGKLRIGSVGAICTDNEIRGVCHRIALLRKLGIEEKAGLHTKVMWNHGETSEINVERVLTAAGLTPSTQDAVTLAVTDEISVTGHPDMLVEVEGVKYGIELKAIFSYNTAALVYLDKKPKNENLIQAATYSMAADRPWILLYSNPNYLSVPFYDKKKTQEKSLKPFYAIFYLEWRGETLWYRHEDEQWTETLVSRQGILDYYGLVAEMETKQDLGPRVVDSYVNGDPSKWGDACKFCVFSSACGDWDNNKNYPDWIENCKSAVTENG